MNNKTLVSELAIFGGTPLFSEIKSTSNLVQPSEEKFNSYLFSSFENKTLSKQGPCVELLEKRLANIHQVKHCITFCNGLWSLVTAMKLLALEGKTEVIMPSLTYRRMADIAAWVGLTPRFCEVENNTLAVSRATIETCINENTALILAAHPIINLCDISGIVTLANEHKIPLLFDSVEASFSSFNNQMVGGFGDAECFSMHASKFLNGFEGGYVTTNNDKLANMLRASSYGDLHHGEEGSMELTLCEPHAAMTLASVDDADNQVKRNLARYREYQHELSTINGMELLKYQENERRTFKNTIVKLNDSWPLSRDDTIKLFHKENMLVRAYYFPALHCKQYSFKVEIGDLTNTKTLSELYLNLPSGDFLQLDDINKIGALIRFIELNGKEVKAAMKGTIYEQDK